MEHVCRQEPVVHGFFVFPKFPSAPPARAVRPSSGSLRSRCAFYSSCSDVWEEARDVCLIDLY